jgi:hypothetical protein
MPRSERCRIRGNCLHGIALPALAQAPVVDGAPGAGREGRRRAARRAGASRRTGLSPSGDHWRVWAGGRKPSAWLWGPSRGHGPATRPSWKTIGAGPAARLLGAGRPARAEARRRGLHGGYWKNPNRLLWPLWADSVEKPLNWLLAEKWPRFAVALL